jgi:ectoine hydroxylase-related dioxygenase (phytanoyl-CoA dioxygenase family)
MLFDRSVGTKVHQDSWYLDTLPQGGVVRAWIALEDITQDCGPFKVYDHTQAHLVEPSAYSLIPSSRIKRSLAITHPPNASGYS